MDAYDKAVAHLTKHPGDIYESWNQANYTGVAFPSHILFQRCVEPGYECLTQWKDGGYGGGPTMAPLMDELMADDRIPRQGHHIQVANLPAFAEWNRKLDAHFGREPKVWKGPEVEVTDEQKENG